jgi:hypothetical protein
MKELIIALMQNQIAMALIVFAVIVVGAFIRLDTITTKDVVIQIITAVCALVTGQALEKNKRITDLTPVDKAAVEAAKEKAVNVVEKEEKDAKE